jgi:hypothetical protein
MNYGLYKKMEIFVCSLYFVILFFVVTPSFQARETRNQKGNVSISFGRICGLPKSDNAQ